MADIAAFNGVHYSPELAGSLGHLIAPPYDVISPAEQATLYDRHPCNVVRVILNRDAADASGSGPHRGAAHHLRTWLTDGVLVEDPEPAIYLYVQTFTSPITGQRCERTAFLCALRLAPYEAGVVLPHEYTKPAAKADRLALMRATAANTEPIMGLYEDPGQQIISALIEQTRGLSPMLRAEVDGDVHEVWAVTDGATVAGVQAAMAERRIWIADGHHRYETALTYSAEKPDADRIMIALIPFEEPGLVVLPTHRMVSGLARDAADRLMDEMADHFDIEDVDDDERLPDRINGMRSADGAFIMAAGRSLRFMKLRDPSIMEASAPDRSAAWRALDVSILQTLVLDRAHAIAPSVEVSYTRFATEALARARAGEVAMAFIVGFPTAQDLRQVTSAGDRMPPKSTYFEPKLWSGLLMRRFDAA